MNGKCIFLIGPRASGKTTFGGILARRLGCSFCDTDVLVQAEAGMDVAGIVAEDGWEGFRRRESTALRAAARPDWVVATGGGMVLDEGNRNFMREAGVVIYLQVPAEILEQRLTASLNPGLRPSLTGESPVEEVRRILAEREPLYRATAHIILDASVSLNALVPNALRELRGQFGLEGPDAG